MPNNTPTMTTDRAGAILLNVPYIHQVQDTPHDFDGRSACGSTSAVMVLAAYGLLDPRPEGYGWYIPNAYINRWGKVFSHTEMANPPASTNMVAGAFGHCTRGNLAQAINVADYISLHKLPATFIGASFSTARRLLSEGKPVIFGTQIEGQGHVVVLKGLTSDGRFIVNDPARRAAMGQPGKIYSQSDFETKIFMIELGQSLNPSDSDTVVDYQVIISNGDMVNVRSGPGRSFNPPLQTVMGDSNHRYQVSREAHGDAIPDPRQPSGSDDVWCFIEGLNGYVSRAFLTRVS